jgi:hypothetical protein
MHRYVAGRQGFIAVLCVLTAGVAVADETKKDTPLQTAVREGVKVLLLSEKNVPMMEQFLNDEKLPQLREKLEKTQKNPVAETVFDLGKAAEELELRKDDYARENAYWQVNYDYTMARLVARQARLMEYNAMLGKVRRDDLPALDKDKHKGWHLAPKQELSDKDAKAMADQARLLLKKLVKDHAGTPWELIATKELNEPLGLEWLPLAR